MMIAPYCTCRSSAFCRIARAAFGSYPLSTASRDAGRGGQFQLLTNDDT